MSTTTTTARTFRAFGTCSGGHTVNTTWDAVECGWLTCPCGRRAVAKSLAVKHNDKECSATCQGAVGPSCSCSCGGENHGGRHAFR